MGKSFHPIQLGKRRLGPKEAERRALDLQMVASSSQQRRVCTTAARAVRSMACMAARFKHTCFSTRSVILVKPICRFRCRINTPGVVSGSVNAAIFGRGLIRFIGLRVTDAVRAGGVDAREE
jgi:hypothetical protein